MSPIHRADTNTGREAISPSTIRKSARSFSRRSSSTRPFCAGCVARLFLHPRVALRYCPSHKPRPIVASYLMPHRSMRASEIGSMLPRRSEEEGLPSQSLPPECILVAYPRTLHVPVFAQAEIRLEVLKNVVVSDSSVSPRKYTPRIENHIWLARRSQQQAVQRGAAANLRPSLRKLSEQYDASAGARKPG